MFPKKGRLFPDRNDRHSGRQKFPAIIATALQAELGPSHRAAKTLMRWTGASERTVKQWLTGVHGPRGEHLVVLLRESDAVFESVLLAAGRHDVALAARALAARTSLEELLANFDDQEERPRPTRNYDAPARSADPPGNDRKDGRMNDCMNDRDSGPKGRPIRSRQRATLNPRQRWYLDAPGSGLDVRAADLRHRWGVFGEDGPA